jgi:ketosteroid isomerase-like protein
MPEDHVQLVRTALDAINRRDFDTAFTRVAPDAELDFSRADGLERGVYDLEGFRALAEEFTGGWESIRYSADEFIEAGEHVVVPFTIHLRGRGGIEMQPRGVWVWTIRDGLVTRVCLYQAREEALAAVGMRE